MVIIVGSSKFNLKRFLLFNISAISANETLHAEDLSFNDITPSDWVYRSLNALNYFWQVKFCFFVTYIIRKIRKFV